MTIGGFARNQSGNVAMIAGLVFPVLIGGAALAVDYAYYTVVKGELQGAADAAATAGVVSLTSAAQARAAALKLAHMNVDTNDGTVAEESDVEIGIYNSNDRSFTVSSVQPNAVRVTTGRTQARGNAPNAIFSAIWGHEHQEIYAVAVAVALQRACLYALNASENDAFYMTGAAKLSLPNCGVQVNSTAKEAARTTGKSSVSSASFTVVGGYSGSGFNPVPRRGPPQPDPYAHIPEPDVPSGCTYTDEEFDSSASFPAGTRFCGNTKFKNGSFSFAPGVHYFTGDDVTFETTGDVEVDSGMFYFGPNVKKTRIAAKGNFQLTAMQSGAYSGIGIFQSRETLKKPTMLIEGGAGLDIDSVIYTPDTHLEMAGKSEGLVAKTGTVVADRVTFRGKSRFSIAQRNSRLPRTSVLVQ